MTTHAVDGSQTKAARVVGASYLIALLPAIFAEFYVPSQIIVTGDAGQTALNIVAHERLFRTGIAANLIVFAVDVVLISALYIILKPVRRRLALLALCWGLIETATLVIVTLGDLNVLSFLNGADYLKVFEPDRLQALAQRSLSAHGDVYNVGLVFAGLRSSVFCYLWFKSEFIPKALALWGIVASSLMGACAFAFIIFPEFSKVVSVELYGGPIFAFELTMGFWLLMRGLRTD